MKTNTTLLSLAVAALFVYSCATKKAEPAKPEPAATPAVAEAPKPAPSAVKALSPELLEGKDLYDNNCAKCHKLFNPTDFSKEDWGPIIARMQKKAHTDDVQTAKIYNYVTNGLK